MNQRMFFEEEYTRVLLIALNEYKHRNVDDIFKDKENEELKQDTAKAIEMEEFLRDLLKRLRSEG